MATYRCLWCGELYLPKEGAVRSYYCTRSHREMMYRFKERCEKNRRVFLETFAHHHGYHNLATASPHPNRQANTISEMMGFVEPRCQRVVLQLLKQIQENSGGERIAP